MHILVVEDEPIVADICGMTLEEAGYFKTSADSIESALFELEHNQIDAVLLDLNLPDGDGTRLARLIAKTKCPCPFWWCQEIVALIIRLPHLVLAPDGYLTKLFDSYRLVANLDAIIRRTHGHSSATVNVGNLMVDLSKNYAKIGDAQLDLKAKEFRIIEFFALRKGAVVSKDAFLNHLYGGIDEPEPKITDVFMCKLRCKLAYAGASGVVIDTIWGQGNFLRKCVITMR
jgi:two-component system cell cycle response regulator CtrA